MNKKNSRKFSAEMMFISADKVFIVDYTFKKVTPLGKLTKGASLLRMCDLSIKTVRGTSSVTTQMKIGHMENFEYSVGRRHRKTFLSPLSVVCF